MFLDKLFAADPVSNLRNPAAWLLHSFGGSPTSSGVQVNTSNALTVASYFACLRNLSEDVGTLPIFLYRRRAEGGRDRVTNHPLNRILVLKPNQYMTSTVFRRALMFTAASWGNSYAEIVRSRRGQIVALNFIHPSRVKVRREHGVVWYEVRGEINGEHIDVRLDFEEMLHIKGPSEDGIVGLTMIQLIAQSVGVALAEQDYNGEVFSNGAVVSGVLSHPKTLGEDSHNLLRESWKQFTGSGNRHKPLILEEGMNWTQMGIPPRDAQFIESRNFTVAEIARWFRMPPHKIMHLEDATYSNIESQDRQYVTDTLMPWMLGMEQEFDFKLLSDGELGRGLFIKHDAKGRLRGDTMARAAFYRTLFNMAALSPDEIRELEDMNPIEDDGGDRHYMQINLAPIDELPGPDDNAPEPPPEDGDEPDDDPDPPEPPDPTEDEEEDDEQSAIGILVQDAVTRVCRRSEKMKNPDLANQISHLHSTLGPILLAFGRSLPLDFYTALSADDFQDPEALTNLIMENLQDDS